MKQLLQSLRTALSELVNGRPMTPPPEKTMVITVDIQKQLNQQNEPASQPESPPAVPQVEANLHPSLKNEKIVVLPFDDPNLLSEFAKTNRDVVYKYLLKRLKKAIDMKMDGVVVFQFKTQQKVANIGRDRYEAQLNEMMSWFVETEDYESAATCRDLIRQLTHTNPVDQPM